MRRVLFLIIVLCSNVASAQDPSQVPKLIPPTPNAAALEKFGTVPVSYSTGVPSINYPMWSWKKGKLQLNIGLSYHAGGHKVDDMASNVGLGWALDGIGRISRTVRGLPDDDTLHGFIFTPVLPQATTHLYNGDYVYTSPFLFVQAGVPANTAITQLNTTYSDTIKKITEGSLDGEQDVFSYNFNGTSGRFVFNKNKQIIPLEHTNTRIEAIYSTYINGSPMGQIIAFKITDEQGVVYEFSCKEDQGTTTYTDAGVVPPPPLQAYNSGWLLTKVLSPGTIDSIMIYYNGYCGGSYEGGFSENRSFNYDALMDYNINYSGKLHTSHTTSSFMVSNTNGPSVDSVSFPDGASLKLLYDYTRDDLDNSKALTAVVIKSGSDTIKNIGLHYSYFTSGFSPFYPLFAVTNNDFSKRLRLDSVSDIAGTEIKRTKFSYNTTELNQRGSKNIDYWGYNVNPARNNAYYAATTRLLREDYVVDSLYGLFLDGSDRSPDSVYVKAAVLERVDYPTGGYTAFDYECNKAFSAINYYENKINLDPFEWYQSDFNDSISFSTQFRIDSVLELIFRVDEFDPRPVPNPNVPQICLVNQQDDYTARFEIRSTDDSVFMVVEDIYGHFIGAGTKKVLKLPAGKTYTIKFVYAALGCAYQYPFKAIVSGFYYVPLQDKLAGGLRIKKITSYDGLGNTLVKKYNYNDSLGRSTAVLNNIPNYGYYRSTADVSKDDPEGTILFWVRYLNVSSNPTQSLSYFNGSPLIYSKVREFEIDSSYIERQFSPIVHLSTGGNEYYPYLPYQDLPNLSGLPTKEKIKTNFSVLKKERKLGYTHYQVRLFDELNRNVKTGIIATAANYTANYYVADQYFMWTGRAEQTADTTITYEDGIALTQVEAKSYDLNSLYLRSVETSNSKGELLKKRLKYPFDFSAGGNVYQEMVLNNILSPIIEQVDSNLTKGIEIAKQKTTFLKYNTKIIMPYEVQSSLNGNPLETNIRFQKYDASGNAVQFASRKGDSIAIIWNHLNTYPVAEVKNSDNVSTAFTSFEAEGKGNWSYAGAITADASSPTGDKCYSLGSGDITKDGLSPGITYTISYWRKSGGAFSVNGSSTPSRTGNTINNWTLYEHEFSGNSSVTISGAGYVDEVRLYPKGALMNTYTYAPLKGMTSQCDANNKIVYYEYDEFGRLKIIKDQHKNILKAFDYKYQQNQ